ncbi:MAG: hypothetical protein GW809_02475 [Bacteroidetes bacterium]|nr:hypothetical protein [Bacteroidota bacterium]
MFESKEYKKLELAPKRIVPLLVCPIDVMYLSSIPLCNWIGSKVPFFKIKAPEPKDPTQISPDLSSKIGFKLGLISGA